MLKIYFWNNCILYVAIASLSHIVPINQYNLTMLRTFISKVPVIFIESGAVLANCLINF
jgi:uncharacterized membrane protein YcaP (DUF421 family)